MFSAESTWGVLSRSGKNVSDYEPSIIYHMNDRILGDNQLRQRKEDFDPPNGYSLRRNGSQRIYVYPETLMWETKFR
jgi:hypothetical protein